MRLRLIYIFCFLFLVSTSKEKDYKKYDRAIKFFNKNEFKKSKDLLFKIIEKTMIGTNLICFCQIYI